MERHDLPAHLGAEELDRRHLLRRGRVLSSVEQIAFTARSELYG